MCQEVRGISVRAEASEFLVAMLMIHIDSELLPETGYSDASRCWLSKWFVSVSHPLQACLLLRLSHSSNLIQPHPTSSEWQRRASSDWTNHDVHKVNTFTRPATLQASHTAATEERRKDVTEQRQKKKRMINEGWAGTEEHDSHRQTGDAFTVLSLSRSWDPQ